MSRPIGKDWEQFVATWHCTDHEGKVKLAKKFNVNYDTARHWVSDNGAGQKPVAKEARMTMNAEEILGSRPSVNLDFCCFDIETSNLDADFSVMLSAAFKTYGCEPFALRSDDYPEWKSNRADDHRIVEDIAKELRKHAIIITHYGMYFDIPFLRAKMAKHGIEPLPPMLGIDTWHIAKKNFKVTRRSLQNLVTFFDIGEKGGVEGRLWMKAAYNGDKGAMDEIVKHNIIDVQILEKLACISFPYLKSVPRL